MTKSQSNMKKRLTMIAVLILIVSIFSANSFAIGYPFSTTVNLEANLTFKRPISPGDVNRANYTVEYHYADTSENTTTSYSYSLFELTPTADGDYTIEVTSATGLTDTHIILYTTFDPQNPRNGLIEGNDDISSQNYFSKITVNLTANTHYYLVLTTFRAGDTGTVTFGVNPGTISFSEVTTASAPVVRVPMKKEPNTVRTSSTGSQTNDLSYLVAIPEQWMDSTKSVDFWIDSTVARTTATENVYLDSAKAILKSVGSKLLDTYRVDLMQRVTSQDGSAVDAKVAQEYIRGNFTIRLPIPTSLLTTKNLGIVYIEETGLTANISSKIVTIDGVKFIEFENNRSAVYGFVSDPNNAAVIS